MDTISALASQAVLKKSQGDFAKAKDSKTKEEPGLFSQMLKEKSDVDKGDSRKFESNSEMKVRSVKDKMDSQKDIRAKSDSSEDSKVQEDSSDSDIQAPPRFQEGIKPKKSEKEKAILKFMDSFESEFKIPVEKIALAMAQLDSEKLASPPEETADAVIEQLDLDADQKQSAKQMYLGMLGDLQKIEHKQNQWPIMAPHSLTQSESALRLDQKLTQKDQRNLGLSKMTNQFWMQDRHSQYMDQKDLNQNLSATAQELKKNSMMDSEADSQALNDLVESTDKNQDSATDLALPSEFSRQKIQNQSSESILAETLNSQPADLSGVSPEDLKKLSQQLKSLKESNQMKSLSEENAGDISSDSSVDFKIENKNSESLKKSTGESLSLNSNENLQTKQQSDKNFSNLNQNQNQQQEGSEKSHFVGKKVEGKKVKVEDLNFRDIASQMQNREMNKADNSFKLGGPLPMDTQQKSDKAIPEQVKEIMNQAQYLVKNGGGEMKVKMTPEGLGEVHLKVMVQDGKVNVQMMAETKETKNAIESSLADLKTSLNAHRLSVDHIKVDVVGQVQTDNQAQLNQNFNSDSHRDSTKQFWNQFNDNFGNRSQREGFFEMANNGYPTRRTTDPLKPLDSLGATENRRIQGKGDGLNLVA